MKKRLCITPCGAAKIWDKHPELGGVQVITTLRLIPAAPTLLQ